MIQLRSLTEHGVGKLGPKGRAGDVERADRNCSRAFRGESCVCCIPTLLVERKQETATIGEEELEGDVAEQVLAFVNLKKVGPSPPAAAMC